MAIKQVPDIRLFWNNDERILKQWGNLDKPYKDISVMPPTYRDILFIVPKDKFVKDEHESEKSGDMELINEVDLFSIAWIIRDIAWELIEEVKIIDTKNSTDSSPTNSLHSDQKLSKIPFFRNSPIMHLIAEKKHLKFSSLPTILPMENLSITSMLSQNMSTI